MYGAVFYPSSLRTNKNPRAGAVAAICALYADGYGAISDPQSYLEVNRSLKLCYLLFTFVRRLKDCLSFLVNKVKLAFWSR